MGPGMAMGEAAGLAAALSLRTGTSPRRLAVAELQNGLRQQGALI